MRKIQTLLLWALTSSQLWAIAIFATVCTMYKYQEDKIVQLNILIQQSEHIIKFAYKYLSPVASSYANIKFNNQLFVSNQLEEEKNLLEVEKLRGEINQIKTQEKQSWITLYATIGGSIIGLVGLGWTIWSGLNNLTQQVQESRQKRISFLLESLSSEKEYLRIGASKALSQYINYCVLELLNSASVESSNIVIRNIEDTLSRVEDTYRNVVIESNNKALLERLEIAAQIQILKSRDSSINTNVDTEKLLGFSESTIIKLREAFKVQYEYAQKAFRLRLRNTKFTSQNTITDYLNQEIQPTVDYLKKMNQVTANVIANWLRKSLKVKLIDLGLDLSNTNLYRANFQNSNMIGYIFNYALMRHSNFRFINFKKCIFYDTDMYGCHLQGCNFQNSNISESNLRKAELFNVTISNCQLLKTVLSEGELTKVRFDNNTNLNSSEFKGAKFKDCHFINIKFNFAHLEDAKFSQQSTFEGVTLFRAIMINSHLVECQISNTKFNGSDLSGVDFSKSTLNNVDFSGANLSGANFTGTKLNNVNFIDAKGLNKTIGLHSDKKV